MSINTKEKKMSWADMEDSSDEEPSKNNLKTNIVIEGFDTISYIENSSKLYSYVIARLKNFSCTGLNTINKNLSNLQNIKIEFFYTKRNLRINKIYKNISKEQFASLYHTLTDEYIKTKDTNVLVKNLYQYCFVEGEIIYLPFFYVDDKYFDTIRNFDSNKSYKLILYPLSI
jgi:hypothetical protein